MKFDIDKFLNDDIENKDHPSDFEFAKNYGVLILRLPFINKDEVNVISYAFLIRDGEIYIFDRKNKNFELLGDFNAFHKFLDVKTDKILSKLNTFHMQIAKLEDDLYDSKIDKSFSNIWLKLKKELVLIERLMAHAMIAFERFLNHYKNSADNYAFRDLQEHINRAFSYSKNAIEKLDYLYEFYRAKQDEKMNKIMFILTLLSGIFLPLSLITGFFGINTGGLPFTHDSYGTIKAVIISIALEIPIIVTIWKMMKD